MPLALNASRKLDERRQRGLIRYYAAAGAGGLAVGVHTTQFAIRDPKVGLFGPLLALAREELDRADFASDAKPLVRVAGVVGDTAQAVREAGLARDLGYHAGLLSLAAMRNATVDELIAHCRAFRRRTRAAVCVLAAILRDPECRRDQDRAVQPVSDDRCRPRGGRE